MTARSKARSLAGLLCCAALAAGCSYSSGPGATSTGPSPTVSSSSPTPSGSGLPADPTTAPATVSATPTGPKPSTTTPGIPECVTSALQIRAIQGGAVVGQEIAAISATNTSAKACELYGYPGVSLFLAGAPLGKPAQRLGTNPAPVLLAPNAAAQATLSDDSSCQAPLSDTVRVYPPDQTSYVDRPLQMRGCTLHINAFAPAD